LLDVFLASRSKPPAKEGDKGVRNHL
jgi:hypothetical protein